MSEFVNDPMFLMVNKKMEGDFATKPYFDLMNSEEIKIQGDDSQSKILCVSNTALTNPSSCYVPVVCSDGSLQLANLFRSASYAYSFGGQLPHLDFACSTTDTTSTTSCKLQGITHALSAAIGLGLSSLVIFSDSTSAIRIATLAVFFGIHQNCHLPRLSKNNAIFKESVKKLSI